jgi:hypothetical protein
MFSFTARVLEQSHWYLAGWIWLEAAPRKLQYESPSVRSLESDPEYYEKGQYLLVFYAELSNYANQTYLFQARELVRKEVVRRGLGRDLAFGAPDRWLKHLIVDDSEGRTTNLKALAAICRGSLRLTVCSEGHLQVKTGQPQPFFAINGFESWADEKGFDLKDGNFLVEEYGNVESLWRRRLLVPKTVITVDSHCPGRDQAVKCATKTEATAELLLTLPRTIVFYMSQRDGSKYNSSSMLHFPFMLTAQHSETPLEYRLSSKVYSMTPEGIHFNAKVLREFGNLAGVYEYDDLKRNGKASLVSKNPADISNDEPLLVMVFYNLVSSEEVWANYCRERTGMYPSSLIAIIRRKF